MSTGTSCTVVNTCRTYTHTHTHTTPSQYLSSGSTVNACIDSPLSLFSTRLKQFHCSQWTFTAATRNVQRDPRFPAPTCGLSGWVHCHQAHGLRQVVEHHCLVLPMPLVGSDHSVDVSVGPIHKILKNGNCVGMLQYLFIESSRRKEAHFTHYSPGQTKVTLKTYCACASVHYTDAVLCDEMMVCGALTRSLARTCFLLLPS